MAKFTITVPDDKVKLIGDAFMAQFPPPAPADPNAPQDPVDPIEHARQTVIGYVNGVVANYLRSQAVTQATADISAAPVNMT